MTEIASNSLFHSNATLSIAIAQCGIVWEDPEVNFSKIEKLAKEAKEKGAEVVIFPESMLTGFSMNIPDIAVSPTSVYIQSLETLAKKLGLALVLSIFVREPYFADDKNEVQVQRKVFKNECFYNRVFFITPEGDTFYQDKRHLFRPAGETHYVSSAASRKLFVYRGFKILLVACYDLRFPVWCRNRANEYDLLIDVANWPQARNDVWRTLLRARAMENLVYVCGVNRVGQDSEGLVYLGDSAIVDPKGRTLAEIAKNEEGIALATIEKAPLESLRKKFPVWIDADDFTLDPAKSYPIY